MPEQRFKPLSIDEMTPDQRRIAERIAGGPRGSLQGPFHPMLRSPGVPLRPLERPAAAKGHETRGNQ